MKRRSRWPYVRWIAARADWDGRHVGRIMLRNAVNGRTWRQSGCLGGDAVDSVRLGRRIWTMFVGSAQPSGGAGGFVVVEEGLAGEA